MVPTLIHIWTILWRCSLFSLMMMMMMNCFVVWLTDKRHSLISSQDHCQRSSPSRISDTPQAGFEPVQNLNSGFHEWSCAVVIRNALFGQIWSKKSKLSVFNLNMQNSMAMFTFSAFDWKYPFWENLFQIVKIVSLRWNLIPNLNM